MAARLVSEPDDDLRQRASPGADSRPRSVGRIAALDAGRLASVPQRSGCSATPEAQLIVEALGHVEPLENSPLSLPPILSSRSATGGASPLEPTHDIRVATGKVGWGQGDTRADQRHATIPTCSQNLTRVECTYTLAEGDIQEHLYGSFDTVYTTFCGGI
jgi:hypothetical protein